VSERSFGGIIFPGYAIVFEESKQTFTVLDETLLVFESKFRIVMVVENDLFIEESYLLLKFVKVSLFQTILLDCLHNRHDEISDLQDEYFKFCVKWCCPQIIIQIADEVNPTFLLPASYRVITRIEI
jgi:hypothetical protein